MFNLSINKLKNAKLQLDPWPHIIIENYIDERTSVKLSKKMQLEFSWKVDTHKDMKDCVKVANNKTYFEHFGSKEFCKILVEKFNNNLPSKYLVSQTNTWHIKGASLPAHTDMHCVLNTNEKLNSNYLDCLTYQIYLPDTAEFPNSGVWLHGKWNDDRYEKIKQISCQPGTFFAYINTKRSYHSVPEQINEFNRVSHMGRIYW